MNAVRCLECGDVRWSFLGLTTKEPARCELCGGAMVTERRRPDGLRRGGHERRETVTSAPRRPSRPIQRPV